MRILYTVGWVDAGLGRVRCPEFSGGGRALSGYGTLTPARVQHQRDLRRGDGRWSTPFGAWVSGYTTMRLVAAMTDAGCPVERHIVYHWLAGRYCPRPSAARAMVALSDGALTLDAIYEHVEAMRRLRGRG